MTSDDLSRGYQQKDTFVITGGPNHCDSEIYGLFLCVHTRFKRHFYFSPLTHNGKVTPLAWSYVTDIKIWDKQLIGAHNIMQSTKFKTSLTNTAGWIWLQTIFWAWSVNLTWWPDLTWPGDKNFAHCPKLMYSRLLQATRRYFYSHARNATGW